MITVDIDTEEELHQIIYMLLIVAYAKQLIPDALNHPKTIWQHTEPFKKDWAYARKLAHKVFVVLNSLFQEDGQETIYLEDTLAAQELELLGWSKEIGENSFLTDMNIRETWLQDI